MRHEKSLHVLSRLKGIETRLETLPLVRLSCLHVLSRLKGIETFFTFFPDSLGDFYMCFPV